MFSLTRQSYALAPGPRPACSGFEELGDPAPRELEHSAHRLGEREDLAGDPERCPVEPRAIGLGQAHRSR
jgi:hypothetical protein